MRCSDAWAYAARVHGCVSCRQRHTGRLPHGVAARSMTLVSRDALKRPCTEAY